MTGIRVISPPRVTASTSQLEGAVPHLFNRVKLGIVH